jgi:ankyrin repeat protein
MPFSEIARIWQSIEHDVQSHVSLTERQALNLYTSDATTGAAASLQHRDEQRRSSTPVEASSRAGGGFRVVHWAALHGFQNVLEHVLTDAALGADGISTMSDSGLTPLHYAAKGGQLEIICMLLSMLASAPPRQGTSTTTATAGLEVSRNGNTIATLAAQFGHVHILEWLQEDGNLRSLLWTSEATRQGRTPLHVGAQVGAINVVQFYQKIAPSLPPLSSSAPLPPHPHRRAGEGGVRQHGDAAGRVRGARFDVCDRYGRTLAHYAAESGRLPVLALLHEAAQCSTGSRHEACCRGMLHNVDNQGATLLHYAARNPLNDVVPYLHETVGLPLFDVDAQGHSPAVWTVLGGKNKKHIACLRYMLRKDRVATLGTMSGEGQPLLTVVRGLYGTECAMFIEMSHMGFVE